MELGILRAHIVDIIRGDEPTIIAIGRLDQLAVDIWKLGDVMMLKLKKEPLTPEDFEVPIQQRPRPLLISLQQGPWNLTGHAARGADQTLAMLREEIMIDAWPVVEALELGGRGDFEQVSIAGIIFGKEKQMESAAILAWIPIPHRAGRHIGFHSDDGFDASLFRRPVEGNGAKHGTMVCERQRRHVHRPGARDQILNLAQTIEQRVF